MQLAALLSLLALFLSLRFFCACALSSLVFSALRTSSIRRLRSCSILDCLCRFGPAASTSGSSLSSLSRPGRASSSGGAAGISNSSFLRCISKPRLILSCSRCRSFFFSVVQQSDKAPLIDTAATDLAETPFGTAVVSAPPWTEAEQGHGRVCETSHKHPRQSGFFGKRGRET